MNFMTKTRPAAPTFDEAVEQTRAALADLDFAEQNAHIAEIDAKVAKITDAIETAKQRAAELRDEEEENRSNSRAIAKALLDGTDPDRAMVKTSSGISIKERKAALLAAVPELASDRTLAVNERQDIVREAEREVARAAQPLIDDLRRQAEIAAERLLGIYADLKALCIATRNSDLVKGKLEHIAADIMREGLRDYRKAFPVSAAIQSLQPALSGKGAAFEHRYPVSKDVGPPQARLLPPIAPPRI